MLGFNSKKTTSSETEVVKEVTKDDALQSVVKVQSHLENHNLAYTSTLDISYVGWVKDHITEEDVEPCVLMQSNYNTGFIKEILDTVIKNISNDLPADYVPPADNLLTTSSDKIEVNILS